MKVIWRVGQSRAKAGWDMGHNPGFEYHDLLDRYLSHKITEEEFLAEYRDPANYRVEDAGRNRSHVDEAPRNG